MLKILCGWASQAFVIVLVFAWPTHVWSEIRIDDTVGAPQTAFGVRQIRNALEASVPPSKSDASPERVVRIVVDDQRVTDGYLLECTDSSCTITGANENEAMYGALDVAERVSLGTQLWTQQTVRRNPYLKRRGIKFNIPLDARTPSYDDSGDAAQRNIAEMWRMEFWTRMFDQMAIHRYNVLTFWNPHPFPSMIKMDAYPNVALDDICVTTLKPTGHENEWGEPQLVSENVMENLAVVREMTIDEKISFWQEVMQYAHDRGIDIYFITWNVCPNSVARPVKENYRTYGINTETEEPGKYGVTHQLDNPATIKYLRESVKQFLLTYPHVKGIGVTAGEHMPKKWTGQNREEWLWNTYGRGILDAKAVETNRKVDFIHRVWFTDLTQVMKFWGDYPDSFELSFKYAKARLYSSPNIPFAREQIEQMKPYGLRSWWNLRNDDIYVHRWGDPDYVRSFLKNFELDHTAGFHMGSDGYVWGREFASRHPKSPRELEVDKHWYRFMLWGRLGYTPELGREFFQRKLEHRFPGVDAVLLYDVWQTASKIIPQVNRGYWQDWDHMWSVECCRGHVEGFHEVTTFVKNKTMQGSGIVPIRKYVASKLANQTTEGISPREVADNLDQLATRTIEMADRLVSSVSEDTGNRRDLLATVEDIRSMAYLGQYYADKFRAAVDLATFQATDDSVHLEASLKSISDALEHCQAYASLGKSRYHSQMLARPGNFDWDEFVASAEQDVELIKEMKVK